MSESPRSIPKGWYLDENTRSTIGKPTMRRIGEPPAVPLTVQEVASVQSFNANLKKVVGKSIGKKQRVPNKTESELLLMLRAEWGGCLVLYEPFTLHCDSCSYTPDVVVISRDVGGILAIHEAKGPFRREKDILRLKAAAAKFPLKFILSEKLKTGWTHTRVRGAYLAAYEG